MSLEDFDHREIALQDIEGIMYITCITLIETFHGFKYVQYTQCVQSKH
jgi:hypothetical protein